MTHHLRCNNNLREDDDYIPRDSTARGSRRGSNARVACLGRAYLTLGTDNTSTNDNKDNPEPMVHAQLTLQKYYRSNACKDDDGSTKPGIVRALCDTEW